MPRFPKYRNKRGYGHCRVGRRDYYFGPHRPEPPPEYWALVARHKAGQLAPRPGKPVPSRDPIDAAELTIVDLIDRFLDHAAVEYRLADGTMSSEYDNYRQALRPLFTLFADEPAADFSPRRLKRVQEHICSVLGWSRQNANKQVSRLRSVFSWAVSEELVPPAMVHGLSCVRGIRAGRAGVRETAPVTMVADEVVEQTLKHLSPTVADMVRLHRMLGARSQDVCNLRWCDIDRRDPVVWLYHPPNHKQAWRGMVRTLYIEPEAQQILSRYADRPADACVFSPADAERQRLAENHAVRRTPPNQGNRPGTHRRANPRRAPGDCYTAASYRRAIRRACVAAFPCPRAVDLAAAAAEWVRQGRPADVARSLAAREHPAWVREVREWDRAHSWHPHQLRHSAGTAFADAGGLEYARIRLGHRHVRTTELYRTIQDDVVIRRIKEARQGTPSAAKSA